MKIRLINALMEGYLTGFEHMYNLLHSRVKDTVRMFRGLST